MKTLLNQQKKFRAYIRRQLGEGVWRTFSDIHLEDLCKLLDEHDEVNIECIGGKMGRAKGDIPGVRWMVTKVNDQSLPALLGGKLEKARK